MRAALCLPVLAAVVLAGGAAAARSAGDDRQWLSAIHQANLAEVQAGELAERKSDSAAVRSVGAMLVTDHTRSDGDVTRTASRLGVDLPATAAPHDAAAAARLEDESGARFDNDFLATMITGHQKAIALTRTEIARGSSPAVTDLARETLPVLAKHLRTLRRATGG